MSSMRYEDVVRMVARMAALQPEPGPFAFEVDDGEGGNLYFVRSGRERRVLDADGRLVAVLL